MGKLMNSLLNLSKSGDAFSIGEGDGSGKGIYSIVVRSYSGSFVKCFTVEVVRSPSSSYDAPDGYTMVSTSTSVSAGGVHITENYIPQMVIDVDTLILLLTDSTNPTTGSASGIVFKAFTREEREDLYTGLGDAGATFKKLMTKAGHGTDFTINIGSTRCLKQLLFGFDTSNIQQIDGLLRKRITPAVFMQIVYAGFGIVIVQGDDGWVLTDMMTMAGGGEGTAVSIENIASLRTSYDYKRMAKSSHIAMNTKGEIVSTRDLDMHDSVLSQSYKHPLYNKMTANAGISRASGLDVELSAPAMPLVNFSKFKNITIGAGTATINMEGDCLGGKPVVVKVAEANKRINRFKRAGSKSTSKKYDISAVAVVLKGMFAKKIHALMIFKNNLETTQVSITIEGVAVPAFSNFTVSGGGGSLQKVIIGPSKAEAEVETADLGDGGFVMSCVIIRSSARVVSTVTYVDMPTVFPQAYGN